MQLIRARSDGLLKSFYLTIIQFSSLTTWTFVGDHNLAGFVSVKQKLKSSIGETKTDSDIQIIRVEARSINGFCVIINKIIREGCPLPPPPAVNKRWQLPSYAVETLISVRYWTVAATLNAVHTLSALTASTYFN